MTNTPPFDTPAIRRHWAGAQALAQAILEKHGVNLWLELKEINELLRIGDDAMARAKWAAVQKQIATIVEQADSADSPTIPTSE